ncbi:PREDICTED: uncharacterized protein LOC106743641 [Dinoponera quadriceps]|uniref:Uncharacterized protein LOC106743641 n=1 Tax=Dinoponera quadriceps TaxID=609295 RepID=A0A6P3X5J0_DINQU|nr:PREDICTED: uncharacterized protein LOC106743641 [Dinoponera quadriceps]XP_014473165.1 PREDICTED: uncharacterized protein LOC106743641 [Dinoponera quadriceps]
MNYSGNMPDWHQYNPPQSGINEVTSTAQNVNSGHLPFISSISPTQLNHGLNLNTEGHEKHQNDPAYNPRHYQPHLPGNISHGHNAADNTPLASMVQMQNCIGHYGPSNTRNPMVDNLNGPMDPRNTAIGGLNEELGYRNNQVPLNGPISHLNGPNVMNMNAPHQHGSVGPRNTNVNSHPASRAGPSSFVSCKGMCCNPDPSISYQQWEKYCSYQNSTTYRENIRASGYQTDTRRFGNDFNFRKDNFDGKEVMPPPSIVPNAPSTNTDHRRNFPDYKYRKDRLLSRSYPPTSGMLQNYPMQNYNYTGEYQKYPYNVKEYSKVSNMNMPSQGMVKHQEQGFMAQQKYNSKQQQVPYQSGDIMSNSMPSTSVNASMMPSAQNTYFNPAQYPRNLPTESAHDCQKVAADNVPMVNRMPMSNMHPPSHSRYQMYQQKIAMQRFSMENQLRELEARVPGYQSHPRYKECLVKYRELLKLQQTVTYQGQMQQTPCVAASTSVNTAASVPPINLQFDQNGVLINSSYMPEAFPRVQQVLNPQAPVDGSDKQSKPEGNGIPDMASVQKSQEQLVLPQQQQTHDVHAAALCPDGLQKQNRYPVQKSLEPNVQFEVQRKTGNENFNNLNGSPGGDTAIQQKISKEFADKPELDVRQFLANWDESEDEDGASSNMQNVVLSNSTPVVVVGYENVNITAKTLEGLEASKPEENQEKSDTVSAQDCLTISYSTPKNVEVAKDACKEVVEVAKESIVQPGSIIQCISNGPDEVPTIHIVDNLEIGSILQVTNGQVTETLERQEVSFFHEGAEVEASAIALEADKFKKSDAGDSPAAIKYNVDLEKLSKENYIVENSPPKTVESTSQTSTRVVDDHQEALPTPAKDNLDSADDINLKKQSSFTSEESHNPDDISLPDLPTSECTPISTTLNTPTHSDSEESSERVEDLTIPTNPIEVVQNSPIISFTQSPMRGEPYDHLNDEAAGAVKSKLADSLENRYQSESHFDGDGSNNTRRRDSVLNAFEFSAGIDKNESTVGMKGDNRDRGSPSGNNTLTRGAKTFPLDGETASAEMTGMCMTLTSGEYELKIVSTGMQNRPARDDKNLTVGRRASKSQAAAGNDAREVQKKLRTLAESSVEARYNESTEELDKALRNIATDSDRRDDAPPQDDANYVGSYEARLLKMTRSEGKSMLNKRKRTPESAHQTVTSATDSSLTSDAKGSRPVEDGCPSKIVRSSPSASHSTKHSILGNDKLRRSEATDKFLEGNPPAESHGINRTSSKIDARDSRSSRHVGRHANRRRSSSGDHVDSHGKRCENTAEKRSEAIVHHNKHTHEAMEHRVKSRAVEDLKVTDVARNEPKTTMTTPMTVATTSKTVDENRERLRLLKEYRRIKYKPAGVAETLSKSNDTQQEVAGDHNSGKRCHTPATCDERAVSLLSDKQLCPKDASFKLPSEEQDRKHAILKTFVNKNVNPDFAIQVTNVNLKLKDNDHQKDLREEAKNSGALDAIKIEINVSCTERNTTEKLLHENIKNAVAETIGHLTSSISSGARSSGSANLRECDKKMICDQAVDPRDRSPSVSTDSAHDDLVRKSEQDNAKTTKYKSAISTCKESVTNDETPDAFSSKKRRSLSSERKIMNNVYEVKDNVNVETESAPNVPEISKTEHAPIRRRSVHQEADQARKIASANFPPNSEESKASSDNPLHTGSTSRGANTQKKDHQEATTAFLCRNARNPQDSVGSKLNAGASTSSGAADPDLQSAAYGNNSTHFDYDHFDVAPNENTDADDKRTDRWKRPKRDDGRFNNLDLYDAASVYMNPIFFNADELENMNTVPVYTTKDGKITYSPNPRFTYHELLMEARTKEGYTREPYFAKSPSFDYYNCSKLRKVFKRNRDSVAVRKREVDPADVKPQFVPKHVDYLPNKNTHHAKNSRNALHLEFFNDNADNLYTGKGDQQEGKETGKKSVVDLGFLEKQCNPDDEPGPNIKHCRTKALAENLDYEKGCNNASSMFDPNAFLEPRALCWEETMESVKSYSSHIDRRNSGNRKELNFSEIFAKQKCLESAFPFLHTGQVSLGGDHGDHKASNDNCDTASESPTLGRTSGYASDDLHSTRHDDSRCEQSDTVACNDRVNTNDDRSCVLSSTTGNVREKSPSAHDALLRDEYAKEQRSQFDQVDIASTVPADEVPPCSPVAPVDDEVHAPEKDECPASLVRDSTLAEPSVADNQSCLPSNEDRSSAEGDAVVKEASDENSAEVTSQLESSADRDGLPDERKCAETVEEPAVSAADDERGAGEIEDSAKTDPGSTDEVVARQEVSRSAPADRRDEEDVPPAAEASVAAEIYFNDETSERDDRNDKENPTVCREEETLASRDPADVAAASLGEENDDERKSRKPRDNERSIGSPPKEPGIDEVDDCGVPALFEPAATLGLQPLVQEEDVCDIFANEKREQNISEFTVIKSIIQADQRQCEEPETRETVKDHDSMIDSKLLCIDSSDCGIYGEARCALMQITEHGFTEDDSMVPMEWETSQIQEDAVNRLCGIDESSIDFAAAANSLRSEDNSLLDNLSLSRSAMKEPRLLELPAEVMNKADEPIAVPTATPPLLTSPPLPVSPPLPPPPLLPASPPLLRKIEATPCQEDEEQQKEQNPVSSSSYEKVAYLSATDCNANTKIVPKLVIKKTETSSKCVTKVSPSSSADNSIGKSASRPNCQPKIPKMIIRNARSRPGTPSIEAVPDEASTQTSVRTFMDVLERTVIAAHEELYENNSESSLQSPASYKIPKMKIKLDEKHANKIVMAEETGELGMKRRNLKKTIPKVKIKNSPRSESSDNSIFNSATPQESSGSLERYKEKIPVLKLRKQERNRSSSPEVVRKRHSSSHSDVSAKRYKRSGRDGNVGHCTRRSSSDSARTAAAECEVKRNAMMCISEKIPKVIIKRTSASAEFKCELSKSGRSVIAKSAKWQPEVKLERYRILDSMAKDLKSSSSLTPVSLRIIDKIFASRRDDCRWRKRHNLHKLSRSNSTSDLHPIRCKQRRMSDYDCVSKDAEGGRSSCSTPKKSASSGGHGKSTDERRKNDKRRSRSRDNNSRTEASVDPVEKKVVEKDQSAVGRSASEKVTSQRDQCRADDDVRREKVAKTEEDSTKLERKTSPKHSSTTDFKTALKELKATSKAENCFVKSPGLSRVFSEEIEERTEKEQRNEDGPLPCKDGDQVAMKERLGSNDMDIECTLQDDAISLKEGISNNFEMDSNAVIKIESSDESQTTIEILPASPDDSRGELEGHVIDDGDSEQLYPADAIPTQFELELEITDNSNIDLLDVSMSRLKPVGCYSSRHASTEECGNQASKVSCYSKPELLHRDKNSSARGERAKVEVEEIPPTFPCGEERTDSQTARREKKFCCNDSLIKEVLAAKETLKKCLSRCESGAKPKTFAEKEQNSSFDLKSLSETHPKSSDALQGCRGAVAPQTGSAAVASRPNKTESIANAEESDKKHSKSSKSVSNVNKRPADERDEELRQTGADTKGRATEEARECTTISLKAFKRFSQAAASREEPPRVINLSEKRKKNPGDQKDTVPQSPRKEEDGKMSSYKIPKISRATDRRSKEAKPKEDNMPILEPAVVVNLDSGFDRESSRSPPVITNQDSGDASKLANNDKVITSDKVDMKDVHKKSEMSIADFVTQLAYHEKATIKHRRYCNLCERWFPTSSRHRRHLAGYQHRHIELTQRRSIHTLFMLFTGNPCPRLVPANVVRNDCAVGELTPLQIAVQDVTKSFDHTEQSPKKQNDVDK